MARRSHAFLDRWHRRSVELVDGSVLSWTLIDAPGRLPHAECFRSTAADGSTWLVDPVSAFELLDGVGHADAGFVPLELALGPRFH